MFAMVIKLTQAALILRKLDISIIPLIPRECDISGAGVIVSILGLDELLCKGVDRD